MDSAIQIHPWTNVNFQDGENYAHYERHFVTDINIMANPIIDINDMILSPVELWLQILRSNIESVEKIYGVQYWENYKKIINPYELVYTQKRNELFPEAISLYKPLSRSFFKMIEILYITNFFEENKKEYITTAHVCEGPGGFIEAILTEAEKRQIIIHDSLAMTLKPVRSNIPGWKRTHNFLQKYKNVKITYGDDGTGDILIYENQNNFINSLTKPVNIFTADGGFDFSLNYDKQESSIFPLLVASARIGLESLKKGGMIVIKFFDIHNETTKDLIFFLSLHFQKWTLYKPAMSRPCNPEQYFVGIGFRGLTTSSKYLLRSWSFIVSKKLQLNNMLPVYFPRIILNVYKYLCSNQLTNIIKQSEYLCNTFYLINIKDTDNGKKIVDILLNKHEKISYDWCVKFNMYVHPTRAKYILDKNKVTYNSKI
jgi:23S rRNA U2552 (ribose-2'-O)-methylase RlmE/FtsJ